MMVVAMRFFTRRSGMVVPALLGLGWSVVFWPAVGGAQLVPPDPLALPATNVHLKVGMVSDAASFEDGGFNWSCKQGLERARRELKVEAVFRESRSQEDFDTNLTALAESGCDLIIGVGSLMHAAMARVANQHPEVKFALVDSVFYPPLANVESLTFNVEEAAFPAGFLAAAWADFKDPKNARVGFVGGIKLEPVQQFVVPFQAGAEYYNRKFSKQVKVFGEYVGSFTNQARGKVVGAAMLAAGVDVIFGVGGQAGVGALQAAKEQGKWGIGVDVDQHATLPEFKDCLLTSCLKRMDNAVFDTVQSVLNGQFEAGGNRVGTLANGEVGLAPFYEFDKQIPEPVRKELEAIQQAIKGGKMATGWPPSYVIPW
jgi:basic membrane protein A